MTTPRYSKGHHDDVARIIFRYADPSGGIDDPTRAVLVFNYIREDFADLFAADNPRRCNVGGHDGPCTPTCEPAGFDRERFLKACGLTDS